MSTNRYSRQSDRKNETQCTDIRRFAEVVSRAVSEALGNEYQVKLQEIIKNNGVVLQGLIILNTGSNLSPTIYLNSFLEAYENHMPLTDIVARILDIYRRELPVTHINMDFFREYETVKEGICYKLINRERNKALLERIPHIDFLDLSLCFFYSYRHEELGEGSILIYNNHIDTWRCKVEDLLIQAKKNTPILYPGKITNMGEVLDSLLGGQECEEEELPMYVLSNEQRVFGAACMIYPQILQEMGKRLGESFYILPSSVHEVILLPLHAAGEVKQMLDMVREINSTQVAPEEVLSDNLYFYNRHENHLEFINS